MELLETLGVDWGKLIGQIVCFAIIFAIFRTFAFKPVQGMLEHRRKKIEESLANAAKIKTELAEVEGQRRAILEEARQKAETIIEQAETSAHAKSEKQLQDAVAQAEAIVRKAQDAMATERQKMISEVKQEVAKLVVETTSKVVGKVLSEDDQKRLNKETEDHLVS